MITKLRLFLATLLISTCFIGCGSMATSDGASRNAAKASQSVFLIAMPLYTGSGTATIVDRTDGHDRGLYEYKALTARHVVARMLNALDKDPENANTSMSMVFRRNFHEPGERVIVEKVEFLHDAEHHDWAVFQFQTHIKLPVIELATKREFIKIKPFERVYAIGCDRGYEPLSRLATIANTSNYHIDKHGQLNSNTYPWNSEPDNFFRLHTAIWYGASGGAVLNKEGKLIGIINAFTFMGRMGSPVTHSGVCVKSWVILRDAQMAKKDIFNR